MVIIYVSEVLKLYFYICTIWGVFYAFLAYTVDKCSLSDFTSIKNKVQYILIAGHHVCLYYCVYIIRKNKDM